MFELCSRVSASRRFERAFTLLEMMVAVSILMVIGLTTAFVTPDLLDSFNRKNAKQIFDSDMRHARSEATREGCRVVVTFLNGGNRYQLGRDHLPYNTPPAADDVFLTRTLPKNVTVTAAQTIAFDSRGYLINSTGDPVSTAITLKLRNVEFLNGAIYASGLVHYD